MRLVFVNQVHPETGHISGVRLWRFASELALRGHRVLQLSEALTPGHVDGPSGLAERLANHDWRSALLVTMRPRRRRLLRCLRGTGLPALLRKAGTAYSMVARGGVFYDWTDAAEPLLPVLRTFAPHLVWATLGTTSNLHLGRQIAHATGAGLGIDIKDFSADFVPPQLQPLLARKFRQALVCTTNCQAYVPPARRLGGGCVPRVVYSGVDDAFFAARRKQAEREGEGRRYMMLIGSIYHPERLDELLVALGAFRSTLVAEDRFDLVYAGTEHKVVSASARNQGIDDWLETHAYLPIERLAQLCGSAWINAYIAAPGLGFHHKLLELITTGRPILAFGGESAESTAIAAGAGVALALPVDAAGVQRTLALWLARPPALPPPPAPDYGWARQAEVLEDAFTTALGVI